MNGALAIAEGLVSQPTAPYFEHAPLAWCEAFVADRPALWSWRDGAGNLVVGAGDPHADRPLVLVAHLDHPGFHIGPGQWTFHGGVPAGHARPGDRVSCFDAAGRATGRAELTAVDEDSGRLRAASATVVEGDALPGGFAMWDLPAWSVEAGHIVSRACDDLLGAAAVLAALEQTDRPVWGLLTRAEEVGFLGAIRAIRLGTVPAASTVVSLECSKALPSAPQGDGVIVRVGDRMSIFSPDLTASLRQVAERTGVRHQRRLMDGGACEATAFCTSGYRASGLAVPLGNYHNAADADAGIAAETVVVDDWLAEVDLLVALANDPSVLDAAPASTPPWFEERAAVAEATLHA